MWFFGKKDKDQEEEQDSKSTKSKRKKKKDESRPWGRKERFLVVGVLLITVLASGLLAASARSWKLPGLPRVELPSLTQQKIVITKEVDSNEESMDKAKRAIDEFNNLTIDLSGVYGLYVENLQTEFAYGKEQREIFQAASLIKLPVMAAAFMQAEEGNLDLDTVYELKESDKIGGSGTLYSQPVGKKYTYQELIKLMGQQSDNTAYGVMSEVLGDEKIEQTIDEIGMRNTSVDTNETTPEDVGVYFRKLWNGRLMNKEHSDELLSYLTDTAYEDWLPQGIPDNVRIAHKFGREARVVNDAGIVYANDPFIVVVLSKGVLEKEAGQVIPQISKTVYEIQTGP